MESEDSLLDEVLGDYLEALDEGRAFDQTRLLEEHPELARDIEEFFADQERVCRWTDPLRPVARSSLSQLLAGVGRPENSTRFPAPTSAGRRFGDYEILQEIGRGGMGVVYKARHIGLNRLVALKMIRGSQWASPGDVQRFRKEAESA